MVLTQQLARHLREIHTGGNWTTVSLKEVMKGVTWQQAIEKVGDFNTIATLVFHTHYYVSATLNVLQGEALNAKDELSFNHPSINSQEDWDALLEKVWSEAERFANLIELLPEATLWEPFTDEKYGTYYRNIQGIIEHTHYHLGQIVVIKKMIANQTN